MNAAAKKLAMAIAGELRGGGNRSPVEQMTVYLSVGRKLRAGAADPTRYGYDAVREIAAFVPGLGNEERAHGILDLAGVGDGGKKFILEQTATPLGNGKHLTLGHWLWLKKHEGWADPGEGGGWILRQLEWLAKSSPPAAVLERVDGLWEEQLRRERAAARAGIEEAVRILQGC